MKNTSLLGAAILLLAIFNFSPMFASTGGGSVMGQVTDPQTKEAIEGATVVLDCQGNQRTFTTDIGGRYYASNIPVGTYTMLVSYMSSQSKLENIKVSEDDVVTLNVLMGGVITMPSAVIYGKGAPLRPILDSRDPERFVLTHAQIKDKPITKASELVEDVSGVVEFDGNYYVHGSREGGLAYYVDGCKIMGDLNIPICGVEVFTVYSNFIPAKYGDATGGVAVIETRSSYTE